MRSFYLILIFLLIGINSFSQYGTISGTVYDDFGPLPGAKVELIGKNKSTSCNPDGFFKFSVEPGNYKVRVTFVMYQSEEKDITITFINLDSELEFILDAGNVIDENIAIGSRSDPRSQLETSVAVDIISPSELEAFGQTQLGQKLQYIIPSFHSTSQTISDGTDHVDPMTLRGLGPDQVLVLVNGKRRHTSSLLNVNGTVGRGSVGTDLNAIPVSAIDRIEILRDGAAAQYGSDAIAGVINIILKEQIGLGTFDVIASPTLQGDGFKTVVSSNHGFEVGNSGFINLSTEFQQMEGVNRSGDYTGNVYTSDDALDLILIDQNNFYDNIDYDNQRVMEIGSANTLNLGAFVNAVIPIKNNVEFYANGGYNYRNGIAHGFYRFPIDENKVVLELYPNGFSPEIHTDIHDRSFTGGVRSERNGWMFDFSNSNGSNTFDFTVNNSNNASLGVASPTTFYSGGFEYMQNSTNLDLSKSIDSLWFISGINFAFGGDFRIENYKINAGEESSWIDGGDTTSTGGSTNAGAQLFPGFQPQNELNKNRVNYASYVDVEANLTKKLLFGIAGRYEKYSDFGNNFSWKVTGRYRFAKNFSLRSAYSTGFRAPSLHQVYFNNIGTQFINGSAFQVGTFNNESGVAKAFGIEQLKPETSQNLSAGITSKIFKKLIVTVDGYAITIRNRIVLSGRFDSGFESILDPLGAGAAQFFTNAVNSQTMGLDVVLGYDFKIGKGNLKINGAMNFTDTKVIGDIARPEVLAGQEDILFNREEISRIEEAQPANKIILLATYKYKKWSFSLRNTQFGEVKYIHPDDGDQSNWVMNELTNQVETRDQTFSAKWLTDLSIKYNVTNHFSWTIGASNLFNVYPDEHKHSSNVSNGRFIYSRRVQQFGVLGASYYTKLSIRL